MDLTPEVIVQLVSSVGVTGLLVIVWLSERTERHKLREELEELEAEYRQYLKDKVRELEATTRPLSPEIIRQAVEAGKKMGEEGAYPWTQK